MFSSGHNCRRRRTGGMIWHMHMMVWSCRRRRTDQWRHIWWLMTTVMVMVHVVLRRRHVELHVAIIAATVRLRIPEHFGRRRDERIAFR